jgi:hypothetical protein
LDPLSLTTVQRPFDWGLVVLVGRDSTALVEPRKMGTDANNVAAVDLGDCRRWLFASIYAIRLANRRRDRRSGRLSVSFDGARCIRIERRERKSARRYVDDRTSLDRRHQIVDGRGRDQP